MSEIKYTTRIRVNEPDRNGRVFTEEALKKAYKDAKNIPLVFIGEDGVRTPIGNVDVEYDNGTLRVSGTLDESR